MNAKPIEQANDAILRLSLPALRRAALRAREVARQTGTRIVVSRNGVIEQIKPGPEPVALSIREPIPPYDEKP